ncbi:hypothetical protein PRIPAC_86771 [Pristionchus pacificus]|uniref:Uncharacterized protein n=1 Tax=Pristionchus pacificus TaxID=54126 RepID=A0A2A6BGS2_PRIPA|nr:hypothetical protein PRIPAC_86771 [Pristionchus pacificus]|eukprot:PDM65079.1 hypothetical protein PRIPAC_53328 [Pristionchus pacificus]
MKCLLIFLLIFASGESLNKFLKHYEPLNYQPTDLSRASRSTDERIRLNFHAYDRDFKLILARVQEKDSVFFKDATFEYENETVKIEWEHNIFQGIIEGEDNSHVSGSIRYGVFEGVIEMSNGEEFWIESSYPYNSTSSFHSFIYSANEIEKPVERTKREYGRIRPPQDLFRPGRNGYHSPEYLERYSSSHYIPYEMCDIEISGKPLPLKGVPSPQENHDSMFSQENNKRRHRSESIKENGIFSNRICGLLITIDHTLYEYVFNGAGRGDVRETRSELKRMMQVQLERVNEIYRKIDFGGITEIHFKIAGFKIWERADQIANPFAGETTNANEFLDWHSAQNHDKDCLSYVFTFRDFEKSTQGLAFACFLCTKAKALGGGKSYNTGMISFRSNGNEVPERLRHLTLAHELAHSLGSNHDQSLLENGVDLESTLYPECDYDKKNGHFIMFQYANDGYKPNHHLFSPCSIRNITRNLRRLLAVDPRTGYDVQTNCLKESDTPICGNGYIEQGEVCDCGYNKQECEDARDDCCWPGDDPFRPCKLKDKRQCSPSQGNCCNEQCQYKGVAEICSPDKDCTSKTNCLADNATCPPSNPINNGLPCDDATGPCETSDNTCIRHCNLEGTCTSTAEISEFFHRKYTQKGRWGHPGLLKKANEVCKEGLGYCDDIGICRDLVHEKSLAQGRTDHGLKTFGEYLQDNWWLLIVIIVIGILILGVCAALCYYKIPKLSLRSLPRETKSIQVEVKAEVSSLELKASDFGVNPATADQSKMSGTVAPSQLTGQWRYPESKETKKKKGGK